VLSAGDLPDFKFQNSISKKAKIGLLGISLQTVTNLRLELIETEQLVELLQIFNQNR